MNNAIIGTAAVIKFAMPVVVSIPKAMLAIKAIIPPRVTENMVNGFLPDRVKRQLVFASAEKIQPHEQKYVLPSRTEVHADVDAFLKVMD